MKIKSVEIDNRKKCLRITVQRRQLELPYGRLRVQPTGADPIVEVFVDTELASSGITYRLSSGVEDSVSVDAFLEYNRDVDHLYGLVLYKLSLVAGNAFESSKVGVRSASRLLRTSPSQIYRLLDAANYSKSIDSVIRLAIAVGFDVDISLRKVASNRAGERGATPTRPVEPQFAYLSGEECAVIPLRSVFRPLGQNRKAA